MKEEDNWPKANKDPEGLSYISDLNHVFTVLLIQDVPTPFRVCISALLQTSINKLFLSVSPIRCAMSIIINSVPVFAVFASLKRSCFQTGQEPGDFASSL